MFTSFYIKKIKIIFKIFLVKIYHMSQSDWLNFFFLTIEVS